MSSEPIELTGDEVSGAVKAANDEAGFRKYSAENVRQIVAAINRVRAGDPVGTIRRSEDGHIAVRAPYGKRGHTGWRVYREHDVEKRTDNCSVEWIGPAGACAWPIVYSPDGAA